MIEVVLRDRQTDKTVKIKLPGNDWVEDHCADWSAGDMYCDCMRATYFGIEVPCNCCKNRFAIDQIFENGKEIEVDSWWNKSW